MSANVEGMVREGVNAFKAGRVDEARALLSKAVELDPYNEQGWLWLSGAVSSADDQRTCLENVLAINPNNARARNGLDFLNRQAAPSETDELAPAPPPAPSAAAPEPPAPAPPVPPPDAAMPSSVEWGAYNAAPAEDEDWGSPAPAPASEYDDWVSGLQLGGETSTRPADDPFAGASISTSPFFDSDDLQAEQSSAAAFSAAITLPPAENAQPRPATPARLPARPAADAEPAGARPWSTADLRDMEVEDEDIEESEAVTGLFPTIPREIRATRLPGTHERGPLLVKLAALLLVPLNLAAALLLLWRLL
jgi:hypothetical protein